MNKDDVVPRYPTREAIDFLSDRLGIAYRGQDWEVISADPDRLEEFLSVYERERLDDDQRFLLMALIVASYDDFAQSQSEAIFWQRIRRHLCERFDLHGYLVEYWSVTNEITDDDDPDSPFAITPRMREILSAFLGPRENWPTRSRAIKRYSEPCGQTPDSVLNVIEIGEARNGDGFYVIWSTIPGRICGERSFVSADAAAHWAETEFGVKPQWKEL